jgi:hypothetical protein
VELRRDGFGWPAAPPQEVIRQGRALAILVLVASTAWAQSHEDSLGLNVAAGGEYSTLIGATSKQTNESGIRIPLEVGGSVGITNKSELHLSGRFEPGVYGVALVGLSFYAGLRQSFGYEKWKTFFDLDAAVHALPFVTLGLRFAFGVQYDFADIAGVYVAAGAQIGGLLHLRLSGELMIGFQFRTYVFEKI